MAAAGDDATGLTQRELLMEVREDIRGLRATVDAIAKDRALGAELVCEGSARRAGPPGRGVRLVGARGVTPTTCE